MRPSVAGAGAAREGDDGQTRVAGFERGGDLLHRLEGIGLKIGPLQGAGPAVEEFDHFGPGLNLHGEIFDGGLGQKLNEAVKGGAVL